MKNKFKIILPLTLIIFIVFTIVGCSQRETEKDRIAEEARIKKIIEESTSKEKEVKETEIVKREIEPIKDEVESVKHIIGSNRESVIKLLKSKGYIIDNKYTQNVDPNAIDLEKDKLGMLVYFNENDIAEGVYIESWDGDFVTGEGSSVSLNYDDLILLASDKGDINVTNDLIKYNNDGLLEFPTLLIIGNVPEN